MPYKNKELGKLKKKEYYLKNRELSLNKNKEWVKNNLERSRDIKRKYGLSHRKELNERSLKFSQSDKGKQYKKQWYRKWANSLGIMTWEEFCIKRSLGKKSIYPKVFNQKIKDYIKLRDNNECKLCGMIEPLSRELYKKSLAIHHIDYNKDNCNEDNLITTCLACNVRVNSNREYWKVYFGLKKPTVCIVIPTIRTDRINTFLNVWEQELKDYTILLIEDREEKEIVVENKNYKNIIHLCHQDIDKELGEKAWIISRQASAVCSYGFYKAWKMGFDVIIKMDDDILLRDLNFVDSHLKQLYKPRPLHWLNTFVGGYPRGFPYAERTNPTVLNYGLADYVLDYDAQTQILKKTYRLRNDLDSIPYGVLAPICGMNIAFVRDIVPALYFGLQGDKYNLDRYDDIWAGIFLKKITDLLGDVISIGEPIITHSRLSNPQISLDKEAGGMLFNELFYKQVEEMKLNKTLTTYKSAYKSLANKLSLPDKEYEKLLKNAMNTWADLF